MKELDDTVYEQVLRLSKTADQQLESGACKNAVSTYLKALDMLPTPKEQWEASTWLSGSAANAFFLDRQYVNALDQLRRTLLMPGAVDNPFIRLRLGQSLYEVGQIEEAKQELLRAYRLAGAEVFEDEHPKYFNLIKSLT